VNGGRDWTDAEMTELLGFMRGEHEAETQGKLALGIDRTREGVRKKIAWMRDTPEGQATAVRLKGRASKVDQRLALRANESRTIEQLRQLVRLIDNGVSPRSLRQRISTVMLELEGEGVR
jgi:hypothetical protein